MLKFSLIQIFYFTDIIHTDGGILGIPWAVGHADFFPNGGFASQPGCINESLSRNNLIGIVGEFKFFWGFGYSEVTWI